MMSNNTIIDGILGGIAFSVLLGGMWMLFRGVRDMGDKF
jgi:hypothetical protein